MGGLFTKSGLVITLTGVTAHARVPADHCTTAPAAVVQPTCNSAGRAGQVTRSSLGSNTATTHNTDPRAGFIGVDEIRMLLEKIFTLI